MTRPEFTEDHIGHLDTVLQVETKYGWEDYATIHDFVELELAFGLVETCHATKKFRLTSYKPGHGRVTVYEKEF